MNERTAASAMDAGGSVTWALWLRALLELLRELLSGVRRLPRARLIASSRSVDRLRVTSSRHANGCTAFIDGAALSDSRCGLAIFYTAGHPLNIHGALELPDSAPPDSNLAELAALAHCLLRHPRHDPLIVFSDSEHALRCAEAVAAPEAIDGRSCRGAGSRRHRRVGSGGNGGSSGGGGGVRSGGVRSGGGGDRGGGGGKHGGSGTPSESSDPPSGCVRDPTRDPRWGCLVLLIHLVLRLRRAPTALYKVWAQRLAVLRVENNILWPGSVENARLYRPCS